MARCSSCARRSDRGHRLAKEEPCFEQFGEGPQTYGYAAAAGLALTCQAEVIGQLVELLAASAEYARRDGRLAPDALFFAAQNAKVVASAERYYREMLGGRAQSCILRDIHMSETLEALRTFLDGRGAGRRIVVWAHNSHLGDARATEMRRRGELNLGQLVRERYGTAGVAVGFTTFAGTVTAVSNWDAPAQCRRVRPALPGSWESLFHAAVRSNFYLELGEAAGHALDTQRLERAIGVVYRPDTERQSHYFHAHLSAEFDAVFHYDVTRAVEPLERTALWARGEVPETYPTTL